MKFTEIIKKDITPTTLSTSKESTSQPKTLSPPHTPVHQSSPASLKDKADDDDSSNGNNWSSPTSDFDLFEIITKDQEPKKSNEGTPAKRRRRSKEKEAASMEMTKKIPMKGSTGGKKKLAASSITNSEKKWEKGLRQKRRSFT